MFVVSISAIYIKKWYFKNSYREDNSKPAPLRFIVQIVNKIRGPCEKEKC